jgi:hypothetical protein
MAGLTLKKSNLSVILGALVVTGALMAPAALARSSFGDGTYRVPADIKPGTYRTRGGDGCYWERLKSFSGSLSSILANENADGPAVVTILPTDKGFKTEGCGTWTSRVAPLTRSRTQFGAGTFAVGIDISPGTYRSRGGDGCYWERLRSFTGGLVAIIANENASGPTIVTITRADKGFESSGCGTWSHL